MTLKNLHENRHLFPVIGNSKPRLRKAILKHGIGNEFINLQSELCFHSAESNFQLPEVVRRRTKQYRSLVRALACKQRNGFLKGNLILQAGGSFFSLLLPIVAGLVNSILYG